VTHAYNPSTRKVGRHEGHKFEARLITHGKTQGLGEEKKKKKDEIRD
jgi:hypothetical protein